MISVKEALQIIEENKVTLKTNKKSLDQLLNRVAAENIPAPISMPPFRQSAMDGYAISQGDSNEYRLVGEVKAGDGFEVKVNKGEAVRIFTGAPVPAEADTVVMQEHVEANLDIIKVQKMPATGANVRPVGEQLKKGELIISKGTTLNAASVGLLASLGLTEAAVYAKPKVTILVTGDELVSPGTPLQNGQIYESNSYMLQNMLRTFGVTKVKIQRVSDDLKSTVDAIKKALKKSDLLLISGGISVGDYDFVKEALTINEVQELFYKVNQKPGKPLWFGKKEDKRVFALPGNPASSFTCFCVYVVPMLRMMMGAESCHLLVFEVTAGEDIPNRYDKDIFLKGIIKDGKVSVLKGQASSMLLPFVTSNALIKVPANVELIKKGEPVDCIQLG